MIKRVYIYVNGIKANPSDPTAWTDCAVTWTHLHTPYYGEKFEYHAGALTRRIHQQRRAESLQRMMEYYHGWEVVLVGHSNGCDIIERCLKIEGSHRAEEIHLFSPACDAQPNDNEFNVKREAGQIQKLFIYIAGRDRAMKFAKFSQIFGKVGLGYGTLGGLDAGVAKALYGKESIIYEASFGHSDWFDKGLDFGATMGLITKINGGIQ